MTIAIQLGNLLSKSKKILKLSEEYEKNNNINVTISNARPPIFWKEKEITIQQIQKWEPKKIKEILDKKNLSRKECLLLPLKTVLKALKI